LQSVDEEVGAASAGLEVWIKEPGRLSSRMGAESRLQKYE